MTVNQKSILFAVLLLGLFGSTQVYAGASAAGEAAAANDTKTGLANFFAEKWFVYEIAAKAGDKGATEKASAK